MIVPCTLYAQDLNNIRYKKIDLNGKDTVKVDTLSIIPGSVVIASVYGKVLDTSYYKIDYANGLVIFEKFFFSNNDIATPSFIVKYRIFPIQFTRKYYHKSIKRIEPNDINLYAPFVYQFDNKGDDIFNFGGINKQGNISRGLSFGNNQDVVVNSNLNLQLSGKLSEDIELLAAITDNSIPFQPDGNTQQIQEFDKVFIQLSNKNNKLIAGDFELQRPNSYFLNVNKKAQGAIINSKIKLSEKKERNLFLTGSGALSKGKYSRNIMNIIEGNQGPYKLTGNEGETYIIIIAGSEKVYIDGVLKTRGQDNDYIIDYNMGEVTFMPRSLITKDKRVVVEFEYSDKNYARSMFFIGAEYQATKFKARFNFFSEQDLKNQPIQQSLSDVQKELLRSIGDSLSWAIVKNIDSVGFNSNDVLYKMVDSTVNSIFYDSILVYSTNSDSAYYRAGFAFTGNNKGNYIQIQSAANGRVFKWIAPVDGVPQGNYEPLTLLVTPKRKQMYTLGLDYNPGKNTIINFETAVSDNNINTFSNIDKANDYGYAFKLNVDNKVNLSKADKKVKWAFSSGLNEEWVYSRFSPVERYRTVEFNRDWNMTTPARPDDENLAGIRLGFENNKSNFFMYNLKSYIKGAEYKGLQNQLVMAYDIKKFFIAAGGSFLNTSTPSFTTQYLKHNVSLVKKFKFMSIGVKEESENNRFVDNISDTLLYNSFSFNQYEAFISSPDSSINKYSVFYKRRYDYLPQNNEMPEISIGDDAGASFDLLKNRKSMLKVSATYRNLQILDSARSANKPDNTLLGRIEYSVRLFKNVITSNTFYEVSSGMEQKKEFSYVEVPAGTGVYKWTDYNGNGIKELNEFEVAAFKDEANYIRIFTPTNQYLKSYSNQFSESFNIDPAVVWSTQKGIKKFFSRFSDQLLYRVEHKSTNSNLLVSYNPFLLSSSDTSMLSLNYSFRNTFFFNKNNPKFGLDLVYQDNSTKMLLVNGFEAKSNILRAIRVRTNFVKFLGFNIDYENGVKTYTSEFFPTNNYKIDFFDIIPRFIIQPGNNFRISLSYTYTYKINRLNSTDETTENHNAGLEFKYNIVSKGSLLLRGNYIEINYNAAENTPLSYEMLEGLKIGSNATWNLSYQRNISNNLQLNLVYDGRVSPGTKVIHVGSVQLRAYF
jgi:hypothetical protein